jgi:hypothetical protein
MHTYKATDGTTFHFNSDLSGSAKIICHGWEVNVPCEAIVEFAQHAIRMRTICETEAFLDADAPSTEQEFIDRVQQALSIGYHIVARDLSSQGLAKYPGSAELQKMAHVLAPPCVVRVDKVGAR